MNKYKKLIENFVERKVNSILEYDFDNFSNKYNGLDNERLNKSVDYLKSRQIRDGLKFKYQSNNANYKGSFSIIPNDIKMLKPTVDDGFFGALENANIIYNVGYSTNKNHPAVQKYYRFFGPDNLLKDNQTDIFRFSIRNVVLEDNRTIDLNCFAYCTFTKLTDKVIPSFRCTVNSLMVGDSNSLRVIPLDIKSQILFNNKIKDLILTNFGKFSTNRLLFTPEVNIDRNALLK